MNGVVSSHRIGPYPYTSSHMRSEDAIFEYFVFFSFLTLIPGFTCLLCYYSASSYHPTSQLTGASLR